MPATVYLRRALINDLLRSTGYTPPATYYIGLLLASGVEVSGGSYARRSVAKGDSLWTDPTLDGGDRAFNVGTLTYTAPTADWGTVVAARAYDAASAGNGLFDITLTGGPVLIRSGDSVFFAAGSISVSIQ